MLNVFRCMSSSSHMNYFDLFIFESICDNLFLLQGFLTGNLMRCFQIGSKKSPILFFQLANEYGYLWRPFLEAKKFLLFECGVICSLEITSFVRIKKAGYFVCTDMICVYLCPLVGLIISDVTLRFIATTECENL